MAATFFVQPCPTCGRNLNVRLQDLTKNVVCSHCKAPFVAVDRDAEPSALHPSETLLARANEILDGGVLEAPELTRVRAS